MTNTSFTLNIRGMDCAGCAQTIQTGVVRLKGVEHCNLNFTSEKLQVSGTVSREAVVARVRELGYEVAEAETTTTPTAPSAPPGFLAFLWSRWETRLALLGLLLILPGLFLHEILHWDEPWIDAFSLGALLVAGGPIARSAWRSLRFNRDLNINVLMTIAAVGAVVIGAYTEAGMVMVLFALGEALEGYTASRARHAIRSLMEVVPQTATRLSSTCCGQGCEERVPVAALAVGDRIVVRPGERIPMDGLVRAGVSLVNQAPITGESRLVEKIMDSAVFAGSINGEGSLELEVTHLAADTTISRMIRLVEEAQERRAPVQRFVDRFARVYTPAVVVLAVLVAALPPLLFGQPFWNPTPAETGWLYRALALLVVACPCALVISTPVSVISAVSAAARNGVLIKGGAYLEQLSRVRVVAFDKTGTLTLGQPSVVQVRSAACSGADQCAECDDVLALAYAIERRSEHPLAHAIVSASRVRGVAERYPVAEDVAALVGRGVNGRVHGREVLVGSHAYFDSAIPHAMPHCHAATHDAGQGYSPVLVSADGVYLGTITMADAVRASSREAVAELRGLGMSTVMLTGDNRHTAERIGAEVGVGVVQADLLPAQKVAAVQALQRQHGPVAMVGDGINDTPALATADVGIAIGGAHGGTGQAMETADITLMSDDLRQLPFAIRLSRAATQTIGVNVAFSIGIKLVFLLLVLLGLGTMWMAVLADVGAALLVTLYGMRLLHYRDASRA
ncbi:MAG: heavy metal translocating P-type ATPase [Chloroflexaceae bacterium]|nr:heavy metal translocating P-type ATPase [Chloroflexaceae bacterium]